MRVLGAYGCISEGMHVLVGIGVFVGVHICWRKQMFVGESVYLWAYTRACACVCGHICVFPGICLWVNMCVCGCKHVFVGESVCLGVYACFW